MNSRNYVPGQEVWFLTENGFIPAVVVKLNKKSIKISFQRHFCESDTKCVPYEKIISKEIPCCIVATYTTEHNIHLKYKLIL